MYLNSTAVLPLDIVHQSGLEEQVSLGQQVITDEVLVGADRHPVAHAQGAQHVQDLVAGGWGGGGEALHEPFNRINRYGQTGGRADRSRNPFPKVFPFPPCFIVLPV
jgi:hypothetical protein